MTTKKVNLVISLKDGVSAGLQKIGKGVKTLGGSFKLMAKVGATAFAAVGAAAFAVSKTIKRSFEFETAKVQLKSLLGSTDAATKRFNELRDFAASTPFQLPELLDASKKLTVFTEGVLGGAKSLKIIGDAAAAVGTPIEEVSFWIGRAYSMLKGGKPFGEAAMRLQEMGILTPKVRDEMEKMQESGASFEDVWKKMNGEMGRFSGSMEELSQTGAGKWSTLMDNMGIAMAEFGNELLEVSKDGIDGLTESIKTLVADGTLERWARNVADAIASIVAQMRAAMDTFDNMRKSRNAYDKATKDIMGADGGTKIGRAKNADLIRARAEQIIAEDKAVEQLKKRMALEEKMLARKAEADAKRKKADDEHWDKLLSETRKADIAAGLTPGPQNDKDGAEKEGVAQLAEKVAKSVQPKRKEEEETNASRDAEVEKKPTVSPSTLELFKDLSKGRSFEGATSALSQVTTAMEGESIKKVAVLLEDQNKILTERLGGVSS